jgi:hypothetical protein
MCFPGLEAFDGDVKRRRSATENDLVTIVVKSFGLNTFQRGTDVGIGGLSPMEGLHQSMHPR